MYFRAQTTLAALLNSCQVGIYENKDQLKASNESTITVTLLKQTFTLVPGLDSNSMWS